MVAFSTVATLVLATTTSVFAVPNPEADTEHKKSHKMKIAIHAYNDQDNNCTRNMYSMLEHEHHVHEGECKSWKHTKSSHETATNSKYDWFNGFTYSVVENYDTYPWDCKVIVHEHHDCKNGNSMVAYTDDSNAENQCNQVAFGRAKGVSVECSKPSKHGEVVIAPDERR